MKHPLQTIIIILLLLTPLQLLAKESTLTIAVAANFQPTLEIIAKHYEQETGTKINIISGSTGKLYLQAKHSAPFDLFFAADSKHPQQLVHDNIAISSSLTTYATARLVMISNSLALNKNGQHVLEQGNFHWLAMANPKLAPCGLASQQVIEHLQLTESLSHKITQGENVNQTLSFVMSKAADLGFVTYSQIKDRLPESHIWVIPSSYYQPIIEQAVILKQSGNINEAQRFLAYISNNTNQALIKQSENP